MIAGVSGDGTSDQIGDIWVESGSTTSWDDSPDDTNYDINLDVDFDGDWSAVYTYTDAGTSENIVYAHLEDGVRSQIATDGASSPLIVQGPRIAADHINNDYMVFYGLDDGALRYSFNGAGSWGSTGSVTPYASVSFPSAQREHFGAAAGNGIFVVSVWNFSGLASQGPSFVWTDDGGATWSSRIYPFDGAAGVGQRALHLSFSPDGDKLLAMMSHEDAGNPGRLTTYDWDGVTLTENAGDNQTFTGLASDPVTVASQDAFFGHIDNNGDVYIAWWDISTETIYLNNSLDR